MNEITRRKYENMPMSDDGPEDDIGKRYRNMPMFDLDLRDDNPTGANFQANRKVKKNSGSRR